MIDVRNRITWTEGDAIHNLQWRSEKSLPPPKKVLIADDTLTVDRAYRLASEGSAFLWRGDFQNARQLLQALARRAERPIKRNAKAITVKAKATPGTVATLSPKDIFNLHRQAQSQRARILDTLLIPISKEHRIPLRRAPDVMQACLEVYGSVSESYVVPLRELLALISAHEWRKKGVFVESLRPGGSQRIYPHYGVFSPLRGEYIRLVATTPLPAAIQSESLAFDIGTGTGVLAAVLAERGIQRIIGTDQDPRALDCARANISQLNLDQQVNVIQIDLFPPGKAPLIVCNPPWLPARPSSPIERAIYDFDSAMLKGFLANLGKHLSAGGEGWLILSDFAEHLGLRSRDALLEWIDAGHLTVLGRVETKPHHPKAMDAKDPLYFARKMEVTSLWRLAQK